MEAGEHKMKEICKLYFYMSVAVFVEFQICCIF